MSLLALAVASVVLALQAAGAKPPLEPARAEPLDPARGKQEPERRQVSVGDFKSLIDHNIFSPPKPPEQKVVRPDRTPDPPKRPERPKPPVVTGFVWDSSTQAYQVIVEDRNESRLRKFEKSKFLKTGDELEGCTVESIVIDRLVLKHGDATKEIRVGESFPAANGGGVEAPESPSPPSTTGEKTESKPVEESDKERALRDLRERLKKRRD
jgi:hypothetical protein